MVLNAGDFRLDHTLESGQVFHWQKLGDAAYAGMIGPWPVLVWQERRRLLAQSPAPREQVRRYFALDHKPAEIHATLPDDEFLRPAIAFCGNLRILRQPHWECLAAFITSSMKQVAHISGINGALRRRYGQPREFAQRTFHTFPEPAVLAEAAEGDLREHCRLGWRAPTLKATAEVIARKKFRLASLRKKSYDDAHKALLKLPGVGPKVANCVLLFAYERLDAFPIDVWIERVLRETYFRDNPDASTAELRQFAHTYFGPNAGYAQQYLFHYWRSKKAEE